MYSFGTRSVRCGGPWVYHSEICTEVLACLTSTLSCKDTKIKLNDKSISQITIKFVIGLNSKHSTSNFYLITNILSISNVC